MPCCQLREGSLRVLTFTPLGDLWSQGQVGHVHDGERLQGHDGHGVQALHEGGVGVDDAVFHHIGTGVQSHGKVQEVLDWHTFCQHQTGIDFFCVADCHRAHCLLQGGPTELYSGN